MLTAAQAQQAMRRGRKNPKKKRSMRTRRGPGGECGWVWREWIGSDVVRCTKSEHFSFVWGTSEPTSHFPSTTTSFDQTVHLLPFFPLLLAFLSLAGCDVIVSFFLQGSEQQTSGIKDGVSCDVRQIRNSSMTRMENEERERIEEKNQWGTEKFAEVQQQCLVWEKLHTAEIYVSRQARAAFDA